MGAENRQRNTNKSGKRVPLGRWFALHTIVGRGIAHVIYLLLVNLQRQT